MKWLKNVVIYYHVKILSIYTIGNETIEASKKSRKTENFAIFNTEIIAEILFRKEGFNTVFRGVLFHCLMSQNLVRKSLSQKNE